MRGPGLPGTPDFIQRIEGVGGPVSKGLFPNNYWSATGAGTRDGRRMLRRPPESKVACDYILRGLAEQFRDALGLNVRQPSSNVPPFRATQWTRRDAFSVAAAGSITRSIGFDNTNVATEVGEGVNGVLTMFRAWIFSDNQGGLVTPSAASMTLFLNGVTPPGFRNVAVGFLASETITDADGSDTFGAIVEPFEVLVPLKLKTGDSLTFTLFGGGGEQQNVAFQAAGWFYPIEVDADGVLGTVADRGSGSRASGGISDRQ